MVGAGEMMMNKKVSKSFDQNKNITSSIPKTYRQFMRQMGMRNVYQVPIRKKGMTGSGIAHQCQDNVHKLQAVYGGRCVVGYNLQERDFRGRHNYWFISHYAWITPEGQLVDVTLNHQFEDFCIFAPIQTYDVNCENYVSPYIFNLPKNYKRRGLTRHSNKTGWEDIPFSLEIDRENHIFRRPMPYFLLPKEYYEERGGFTEPSSATGKSWDEIWSRTFQTL